LPQTVHPKSLLHRPFGFGDKLDDDRPVGGKAMGFLGLIEHLLAAGKMGSLGKIPPQF
jgi:hypothetical protein